MNNENLRKKFPFKLKENCLCQSGRAYTKHLRVPKQRKQFKS